MATQDNTTDTSEVVLRLERLEMEDIKGATEEGRAAGKRWAATEARPIHLRRLQLAHEAGRGGDFWQDLDAFARTTLNDPTAGWQQVWQGDPVDAASVEFGWLEGFVAGALEIYEARD